MVFFPWSWHYKILKKILTRSWLQINLIWSRFLWTNYLIKILTRCCLPIPRIQDLAYKMFHQGTDYRTTDNSLNLYNLRFWIYYSINRRVERTHAVKRCSYGTMRETFILFSSLGTYDIKSYSYVYVYVNVYDVKW